MLRTDEYAARLWAQRPSPRLQMNAGQEAAIKSSSNVAFRLIQGPPGYCIIVLRLISWTHYKFTMCCLDN